MTELSERRLRTATRLVSLHDGSQELLKLRHHRAEQVAVNILHDMGDNHELDDIDNREARTDPELLVGHVLDAVKQGTTEAGEHVLNHELGGAVLAYPQDIRVRGSLGQWNQRVLQSKVQTSQNMTKRVQLPIMTASEKYNKHAPFGPASG